MRAAATVKRQIYFEAQSITARRAYPGRWRVFVSRTMRGFESVPRPSREMRAALQRKQLQLRAI